MILIDTQCIARGQFPIKNDTLNPKEAGWGDGGGVLVFFAPALSFLTLSPLNFWTFNK